MLNLIIRKYLALKNRGLLFKEKVINPWWLKKKCQALGAEVFIGSNVRIASGLTLIAGKASTVIIENGVIIRNNSYIKIRNNAILTLKANSYLGPGSQLFCANAIIIAENVLIGPECILIDYNHDWSPEEGVRRNKEASKPITLEKNVWLGARVIVVAGTQIEENSLIAAGLTVSKTIPKGTKYLGKS